jgi:sulfonate transport system permease protein
MSLVQMSVAVEPATAEQKPKSALQRFARPALALILPLLLALVWELAVRLGFTDGRLVPPPSVIYATFKDLAATGELQHHALATLLRVALGFGFGVAAGTILGAITGYSSFAFRLLDPTLQGLRAIPSIAWVPLFIL